MAVDVVILAAGKGTRMKSRLPKVLHPLAGKPLLAHVVDTAKQLEQSRLCAVVGHGSELIRNHFSNESIHWVAQEEQLGTGHAVQQAINFINDNSVVLILYGDVPLIAAETLKALVASVTADSMALLTVTLAEPRGYGRIIRDHQSRPTAIVEEKDASEEQRLIEEVNTGVMAVHAQHLKAWLPKLSNANAQGEYYLTDLIAFAVEDGIEVVTQQPESAAETQGVNDRLQLEQLERIIQLDVANELMANGVTFADKSRFDCRGRLDAGSDVYIDINCIFEGAVVLGEGVSIGPNCYIKDAQIGDNVAIKANTVIEGPVIIESDVNIGPFARLRPHTVLRRGARIGNFVETKKSEIGPGSKVNHLSYIGDTTVGSEANIGAGTITCNYDGVNKFETRIGDGAFIGSNSALVAPVNIGNQATVGAGSTITRDVADNQLAIGRGKQKEVSGWKRPKKQRKD